MGKPTNLKESAEHGIAGPEPASIAGPDPDVDALARRVAPLKPAAPTEAQQLLDRLLAVRNQFLAAAVSQETTLAAIRGEADRGEVVEKAPPRALTGFFIATTRLISDLEATAKRITEQAQELRERFCTAARDG